MIVLSMIMLDVFAAGRELIDEARDATQAGQDVVARSGDWGAFSVKVTAIWRFRRGGVPTGSADHPGARAKAIIGRVVATCGVVVLMPMRGQLEHNLGHSDQSADDRGTGPWTKCLLKDWDQG